MSLKRQAPQSSPSGPISLVDNATPLIDHMVAATAVAAVPTSGSSTSSPPQQDGGTRATKKRQSTVARTGQACDRCKTRKIRCDGLLGGCSPCRQNKSECTTTDRISQRQVPRGYIEQLETKCADLERQLRQMEAALAAVNLDPSQSQHLSANVTPNHPVDPNLDWNGQNGLKRHWEFPGNGDVKDASSQPNVAFQSPYTLIGSSSLDSGMVPHPVAPQVSLNASHDSKKPMWKSRSSGDQLIGMYSGSSYLNSMRTSALTVLGIEIDLGDLLGSNESPTSRNWMSPNQEKQYSDSNNLDDSLGSFLHSAFNSTQMSQTKMELPSRVEAMMLVEFYFATTHPYLPLLHKPSFLAEFNRMYDIKDYRTTPAQTVIVHMVLAQSLWHISTRHISPTELKHPDLLRSDTNPSYRHYHYCLSLVRHLLDASSLEDLQALLCINIFVRNFAKPGPSPLISKWCIAMVIELGLHRSTQHMHKIAGTSPVALEDELRKRAFWCAISIDAGICTKLGRPISLHPGDFDVELPRRIEDDMITEHGFLQKEIDPSEGCTFDVGFGLFKIAEFTIEIYTKLYGVEKPSRKNYWPIVESIEAKMKAWKESLPNHLRYDPTAPRLETRIHAGNLMLWYNELRILLRHPSLNLSQSAVFNSDNLTICVEASRNILDIIDTLRRDNHLDTTWYATTVPLLATCTILFSIWEKRDTVTQNEIARVKADMDLANDLMGEYGKLHDKTSRLQEVVSQLTNNTMIMLSERHNKGTTSTQQFARLKSQSIAFSTSNKPPPITKTSSPLRHSSFIAPHSDHFAFPTQNTTDQTANAMFVDPSLSIDTSNNSGQQQQTYDPSATTATQTAAAALSAAAHHQQHQLIFSNPSVGFRMDSNHWGHNESWREYINSVTAGVEMGQADCYPASEALMALGQQHQQPEGRDQTTQQGQQGGNTGWGLMGMYDTSRSMGI